MKAHKTTTEKETTQGGRINVRFEPTLRSLVDDLIRLRGAADLSDYMRGLVILDALSADRKLFGISIPAWLTESRVSIKGSDSHGNKPQPGSASKHDK